MSAVLIQNNSSSTNTTQSIQDDKSLVNNKSMLQDKNLTNDDQIKYLAQETGMELTFAKSYLESNNWNLTGAIKGFEKLVENEKYILENKSNPEKVNLRKLGRGFSISNFTIAQEARSQKIERATSEEEFEFYDVSSRKSFVLPDINKFDKELSAFIREDLISVVTLQNLYVAGQLNWWAEVGGCRKLFPLSTVGDGNCLLHAASLGMWGFHDRMLTMRKALHHMLLHPLAKKTLKRRWKYSLWLDNMKCGGLVYTREEWENEWQSVVKLASERPKRIVSSCRISRALSFRSAGNISASLSNESLPHLMEGESLDSLEAIHVYVLANLLCRPIFVIADEMLKDSRGHDIAPIPFGGIYLPLERKVEICCKYPLVLAYDSSHFSTLVPADGEVLYKGQKLSTSIPIVNKSLLLLPLRFALDPGVNWDLVQDDSVKEEILPLTFDEKLSLLRKYLDIVKVPFTNINMPSETKEVEKKSKSGYLSQVFDHVSDMFVGQATSVLLAAKLNVKELPQHYDSMIKNYVASARQRIVSENSQRKCLTTTCRQTPSQNLNSFCESCYEARVRGVQANSNLNNRVQSDNLVRRTADLHIENRAMIPPLSRSNAFDNRAVSPAISSTNNRVNISSSSQDNSFIPGYKQTANNVSRPVSIPEANVLVSRSDAKPFLRSSGFNNDDENEYQQSQDGKLCRSAGCKFYGNSQNEGFCSSCYRQFMKNYRQ